MRLVLFAPAIGGVLTACTTVSFAPPSVPIAYKGDPNGSQTCEPKPTATSVERTVHGAWTVIDTFLAAYNCNAAAAANGRQAFDVPAFLSTTGAAAATALGAAPVTIGIIGTAGNAVFNAGKAYYGPQAKASIYNHAARAILCIRNEFVGIPAYKIEDVAKSEKANNISFAVSMAGANQPPTVAVTADEQYFMMVTDAVCGVHTVLTDRLNNVGSVDPATVASDIIKYAEEAKKKQEEIDKKKAENATNQSGTAKEMALFSGNQREIQKARTEELIHLEIEKLQPKLQECVVTARL